MLDISDSIGKQGGALLKTGLGVVVALCFGFMELQRRSDNASREATEAKLFQLFADHQKDMKDTARSQWQNQGRIADGLNSVALQLARIEAILHVPPDKRKPLADSKPPEVIELKPPM